MGQFLFISFILSYWLYRLLKPMAIWLYNKGWLNPIIVPGLFIWRPVSKAIVQCWRYFYQILEAILAPAIKVVKFLFWAIVVLLGIGAIIFACLLINSWWDGQSDTKHMVTMAWIAFLFLIWTINTAAQQIVNKLGQVNAQLDKIRTERIS